jgi:hypothetical protein
VGIDDKWRRYNQESVPIRSGARASFGCEHRARPWLVFHDYCQPLRFGDLLCRQARYYVDRATGGESDDQM